VALKQHGPKLTNFFASFCSQKEAFPFASLGHDRSAARVSSSAAAISTFGKEMAQAALSRPR
jgi:hypothetical protein